MDRRTFLIGTTSVVLAGNVQACKAVGDIIVVFAVSFVQGAVKGLASQLGEFIGQKSAEYLIEKYNPDVAIRRTYLDENRFSVRIDKISDEFLGRNIGFIARPVFKMLNEKNKIVNIKSKPIVVLPGYKEANIQFSMKNHIPDGVFDVELDLILDSVEGYQKKDLALEVRRNQMSISRIFIG